MKAPTVFRDPGHGWVAECPCLKCGTVQRVRFGTLPETDPAAMDRALAALDDTPRECSGGYHVELTGWVRRWQLDTARDMIMAEIAKQHAATKAA